MGIVIIMSHFGSLGILHPPAVTAVRRFQASRAWDEIILGAKPFS